MFTACLEGVFRRLQWEKSEIRVNEEYLSHLRFADDAVLFSYLGQHLQRMLQELYSESLVVGLKINISKSKVMVNRRAESFPFSLGNEVG